MSLSTEDQTSEYLASRLESVLKALLDSALGVSRVMDHVNKKGETISSVYEVPPNEKSIRLVLQLTNSIGADNVSKRMQSAIADNQENLLAVGLDRSRVLNLESGTRLNSVTEDAYRNTMLDPADVEADLMKVVGGAVSLISSKKYNSMLEIMASKESYDNSVRLALMTFSRLVSDVMGSTSGMPEVRIVEGVVEVLRGDLLIGAYEGLSSDFKREGNEGGFEYEEEQEGDFDDEESEDK